MKTDEEKIQEILSNVDEALTKLDPTVGWFIVVGSAVASHLWTGDLITYKGFPVFVNPTATPISAVIQRYTPHEHTGVLDDKYNN